MDAKQDPHETLNLHPKVSVPGGLKPRMVLLAVGILAALVSAAFILGVRSTENSGESILPSNLYSSAPPSSLDSLPKSYGDIPSPEPEIVPEQREVPPPMPVDLELVKAMFEEVEAARTSAIFFDVTLAPTADDANGFTPTNEVGESTPAKFVSALGGVDAYLNEEYQHPKSPFEIKAGSIIPAALVTGINSDLPGDIVARVTEPVYDTLTGRHVLIPGGAVLYGAYDDVVKNGQDRALVVWQRLIMPNNRSIQLRAMAGVDGIGQSGIAGEVDHHYDRLIGGVLLSTALAFGGNLTRSPENGRDNADVVGDTIAQQGSNIGQRIVERELGVRPTITVDPGTMVNVLVNRDLVLEPYR